MQAMVTYQLDEEVFAEVARDFVLIDHRFCVRVLLNVALKEIERAVVSVEKGANIPGIQSQGTTLGLF